MPTLEAVIRDLRKGITLPSPEYTLRFKFTIDPRKTDEFRNLTNLEIEEHTWVRILSVHSAETQPTVATMISEASNRTYRLKSLSYEPGSITVLVVIAATYSVYDAISKYKDFAESLELLVSELRDQFRRLMDSRRYDDGEISIETVEDVADLRRLRRRSSNKSFINRTIVGYFVFSNLAMLAFLLWLLQSYVRWGK